MSMDVRRLQFATVLTSPQKDVHGASLSPCEGVPSGNDGHTNLKTFSRGESHVNCGRQRSTHTEGFSSDC